MKTRKEFRKEFILHCRSHGLVDGDIAKLLGVTRQWVQFLAGKRIEKYRVKFPCCQNCEDMLKKAR